MCRGQLHHAGHERWRLVSSTPVGNHRPRPRRFPTELHAVVMGAPQPPTAGSAPIGSRATIVELGDAVDAGAQSECTRENSRAAPGERRGVGVRTNLGRPERPGPGGDEASRTSRVPIRARTGSDSRSTATCRSQPALLTTLAVDDHPKPEEATSRSSADLLDDVVLEVAPLAGHACNVLRTARRSARPPHLLHRAESSWLRSPTRTACPDRAVRDDDEHHADDVALTGVSDVGLQDPGGGARRVRPAWLTRPSATAPAPRAAVGPVGPAPADGGGSRLRHREAGATTGPSGAAAGWRARFAL